MSIWRLQRLVTHAAVAAPKRYTKYRGNTVIQEIVVKMSEFRKMINFQCCSMQKKIANLSKYGLLDYGIQIFLTRGVLNDLCPCSASECRVRDAGDEVPGDFTRRAA